MKESKKYWNDIGGVRKDMRKMLSGFIALRMCQKQLVSCKRHFAKLGRQLKHKLKRSLIGKYRGEMVFMVS